MKTKKAGMFAGFVFVVIVLILILILFGSSDDKDESDSSIFPYELGGLDLTYEKSGKEAEDQIKNMHIGEFDILKGYVAQYDDSSGRSAFFWVATLENETNALNLIERMTAAISKGGTPFSTPYKVYVNQPDADYVYYTYGTGQDHYYWYKDEIMVWVALTNFDDNEIESFVNLSISDIG